MTYEEEKIFKERNLEAKKTSLRVESRQLDYLVQITDDFSFHAKVFLKEQKESALALAKQEPSATLLKRLSELAEAAAKLSSDFNELSTVKLKQADNLSLADFEK
jgi:hypothetical protein